MTCCNCPYLTTDTFHEYHYNCEGDELGLGPVTRLWCELPNCAYLPVEPQFDDIVNYDDDDLPF